MLDPHCCLYLHSTKRVSEKEVGKRQGEVLRRKWWNDIISTNSL
jgi:hypothetical protein